MDANLSHKITRREFLRGAFRLGGALMLALFNRKSGVAAAQSETLTEHLSERSAESDAQTVDPISAHHKPSVIYIKG